MKMQESGEMYLETILVLSREKATVRAIDVAVHEGYSKPSVSRAVKLLREAGYILVDGAGAITLTEEGRKIAESIYERHVTLTDFFRAIGVPEKIAEEDACKIEHVISDTTFTALKKAIRKIQD